MPISNPVSRIRSIQRGQISIAAGATTGTATISAVDTTKAQLRMTGYTSATNTAAPTKASIATCTARLTLTNATTITANRGGNDADFLAGVVDYEVTEWI